MSTVAIVRPRTLVLGDLFARGHGRLAHLTADLVLIVGAAGFVGAMAQITIHLSFTPVPITGQTLGVLIAGNALGWRRAATSMALYAVLGIAGLPWFAGGTSGYASASFGYIIGFFFAAAACGYLASWGTDRSVLKSVPAMLIGEIVIYIFGCSWLALDLHLSVAATISEGFTPFVAGDAIKAAIAAGLLPLAWRFVPIRYQRAVTANAPAEDPREQQIAGQTPRSSDGGSH